MGSGNNAKGLPLAPSRTIVPTLYENVLLFCSCFSPHIGTWALRTAFLAGSPGRKPHSASNRIPKVKIASDIGSTFGRPGVVPGRGYAPRFRSCCEKKAPKNVIRYSSFSFKATLHASLGNLKLYSYQYSGFSPSTPEANLLSSYDTIGHQPRNS
jgi:hypothetical protein